MIERIPKLAPLKIDGEFHLRLLELCPFDTFFGSYSPFFTGEVKCNKLNEHFG